MTTTCWIGVAARGAWAEASAGAASDDQRDGDEDQATHAYMVNRRDSSRKLPPGLGVVGLRVGGRLAQAVEVDAR